MSSINIDNVKQPIIYFPNIKSIYNVDPKLYKDLLALYHFLDPSIDIDGDVVAAGEIIKELVKKISDENKKTVAGVIC